MMLPFFVFLVAACLSGALVPIFVRFSLAEVPPLTVTAIRFIGAALILFPFWFAKKEMLKGKDIIFVIPFVMNMAFYSIGIQYTSITMGSILYAMVPLLVAVFGYFLLSEKLSKNHIIGLVLSLVGVGILLSKSIETSSIISFGTPLGNLIILGGVFAWSFWILGSRRLSKTYSSVTILFYAFLIGSIGLLFLLPFEWQVRPFIFSNISIKTGMSLIGVAIVSVVAYFLMQWLIKHTSAFVASLVQYGVVLFATIAGIILFQEQVSLELFIGAFFVIIGVFLATTYQQLKKIK